MSKVAAKALMLVAERQVAASKELKILCEQVKNYLNKFLDEHKGDDISHLNALQTTILNALNKDFELSTYNKKLLFEFEEKFKHHPGYKLLFNRTPEYLTLARSIIVENGIGFLIKGVTHGEFSFEPEYPDVTSTKRMFCSASKDLDCSAFTKDKFWGTGLPAAYAALYLSILSEFSPESIPDAPLHCSRVRVPISRLECEVEATKLPKYIDIIHSSYVIAAGHGEKLGIDELSKTGDCSSALTSICPELGEFVTIHLLYLYRFCTGDGEYKNLEVSKPNLIKYLEYIASPEDLQVGDIFFWRTFLDDQDPKTSDGHRGHVGIILDWDDTSVTIVSLSRGLPDIDGYGIREIKLDLFNKRLVQGFFRYISESELYVPEDLLPESDIIDFNALYEAIVMLVSDGKEDLSIAGSGGGGCPGDGYITPPPEPYALGVSGDMSP